MRKAQDVHPIILQRIAVQDKWAGFGEGFISGYSQDMSSKGIMLMKKKAK